MDIWSKAITFGALCDIFEAVSKQSDKIEKMLVLLDFARYCRSALEMASNVVEDSLFPVIRLFLPQLDRERGSYGINESHLAQFFIDLLNISASSVDAQRLMNYKTPKSASNATFNDFASVLFDVLKNFNYSRPRTPITLFEVNENLDKVAVNSQKKGVNEILIYLFRKMDATMFKWLGRIILKDVKIGLSQTKVFNQFHADATDLYETTNATFRNVCQLLKDPNTWLCDLKIPYDAKSKAF